jgi:hypothetical protein
MRDFERVMLAIYEATIETSKPYVEVKPLLASLNLPQESDATIMLHQRGFIGNSLSVRSVCPWTAWRMPRNGYWSTNVVNVGIQLGVCRHESVCRWRRRAQIGETFAVALASRPCGCSASIVPFGATDSRYQS